jgi:Tat protein translocase TatB subunit
VTPLIGDNNTGGAVVALVVIGPERLPKVARMAGNLLGRAQRYMAEVKSEVNRQVELDELRKMQEAATSAVKDVESSINQVTSEASSNLNDPEFSYDFDNNYGFRIGAMCPRKLLCWLRGGGESSRVSVKWHSPGNFFSFTTNTKISSAINSKSSTRQITCANHDQA